MRKRQSLDGSFRSPFNSGRRNVSSIMGSGGALGSTEHLQGGGEDDLQVMSVMSVHSVLYVGISMPTSVLTPHRVRPPRWRQYIDPMHVM
jgi:hypothetical protein